MPDRSIELSKIGQLNDIGLFFTLLYQRSHTKNIRIYFHHHIKPLAPSAP